MNKEENDIVERILIPYVNGLEKLLCSKKTGGYQCNTKSLRDCYLCKIMMPEKQCSIHISKENERYVVIKEFLIKNNRYCEYMEQLEFEF